jgi:hypothetical protein
MDAAGSDDALGYSGIDRNGVAGPRLVVAGEHVGGDGEDHSGIGGRQHGVRHRAHGTALHAAVVISYGRARIGHAVLGVHRVMVVFAMASGLGMMIRDVGTMLAVGCGGCGQLQPGALPPGGCAGDKRKRDGQDQEMAQNMTHAAMLAGRTGNHQHTLPERNCVI